MLDQQGGLLWLTLKVELVSHNFSLIIRDKKLKK